MVKLKKIPTVLQNFHWTSHPLLSPQQSLTFEVSRSDNGEICHFSPHADSGVANTLKEERGKNYSNLIWIKWDLIQANLRDKKFLCFAPKPSPPLSDSDSIFHLFYWRINVHWILIKTACQHGYLSSVRLIDEQNPVDRSTGAPPPHPPFAHEMRQKVSPPEWSR